ncbi:hypothetical protein, partial [Odoribacter splanchnicus]
LLFVSNLSISLRTLLLLFYPPHLRGESGCKDKYFYIFPPNLSALFFKLFFRNRRRRKLLQDSSEKDEKHIRQNVSEPPLRFRKRLQR